MTMPATSLPSIELSHISKMFGSVFANNDISVSFFKGEIHALLGENGAGKTTLMNCLYGMLQPDSGDIFIDGSKKIIKNPRDAIMLKIGMVHQHFMIVEPFTVAENIVLGQEPCKGLFFNTSAARKITMELGIKYGLHIDPDSKVEHLSVGQQQRVEILKTLYRGADILILDEPTAVLTPQEIADLKIILRNMATDGKTIIIITHKLKEIKSLADKVTIIRHGKLIETVNAGLLSESQMAEHMVGRPIRFFQDRSTFSPGRNLFEVHNLCVNDDRVVQKVHNLSFKIRSGEILGIAGVDGNGQKELVESITGIRPRTCGSISIDDIQTKCFSPHALKQAGIAHIPEDRQKRGLVLEYSIAENCILDDFANARFSRFSILLNNPIRAFAQALIARFDIRPTDPDLKSSTLSGGNQQKIIIARAIANQPAVLIAAQPTRGLDVGAIEYVHKELLSQRDQGKAVLLVSLELDEIFALSDRILVLYEGKIVYETSTREANEATIGLYMAGGVA